MGTREEAQAVVDRLQPILQKTTIKARRGDDEAAVRLIRLLAELHGTLKNLGYRLTDETDEGELNRLVPITQEWIDFVRSQETEIDVLRRKARDDEEAAKEFIMRLKDEL